MHRWVNTFALNSVGIVLWKIRVENLKLRLICISRGLTDVSIDLLPRRLFGQALAEALKTNSSVTSIDLTLKSFGDEGVKAFVPRFQVAAHGVFVASLLKGFVGCSCSSFACPGSKMFQMLLTVSKVGELLIELKSICHSVWYDVTCFLHHPTELLA